MTVATKIMMGSGAVDVPSDDDFNTVALLSHFDGANNGGNSVFDDESASNHTITAVSDIAQGSFSPFSKPDGEWGAYFAGNDSTFITLPANSLNLGTNNFTLEGWVYTTSTAQQAMVGNLIAQNGLGSYLIILNDSYTSKKIRFYCKYNGGTTLDITEESGTLSVNSWNHIAVTRDSANLRIFINGTQAGSTNTTLGSYTIDPPQGSGNTSAYLIGRTTDADSYSGSRMPFIGYLSNLRVVVGTAVYTSNFTPPTASLTAISGTVLLALQSNRFVDNSDSAHAITLVGSPKVTPFSPLATEVYNPAVNGGNATGSGTQYLTAASSSDFAIGTSDFCIEMWLFPTTTPDGALEIPFSTRISANGDYMFLHYDNNQISIGTSSAFKLNLATTAIKPIQWNHVCWARSSGVSMAFINGVKIGQANDTTNYLQSGVTVFGINTQQFDGHLSCLRFVNGSNPRGTSTFAIPTTPPTAVTNTKLLLNMANAQAFDSAAQNNMTLYGNANTSTDQAKFGDSSLHLDGTGDFVGLSGSYVFGFGVHDYTVEMFVYHTSISGQQTYFSDPKGNNAGVYFYKDSNHKLGLYYSGQIVTGSGNVPANQWVHVALCRASGTSRLFLDGVLQGSASDTTNLTETAYSIGNSVNDDNEFIGYIDDIRVSRMARYTSAFTAPSEPFPDKG